MHSEYGQILRSVGRLIKDRVSSDSATLSPRELDAVEVEAEETSGLRDLELVSYEEFIAASWVTGAGRTENRGYAELSIADLREHARTAHHWRAQSAQAAGDSEELLRTLGQELDAAHVQLIAVFERDHEFLVTSSSPSEHLYRTYRKGALRTISEQRQLLRRSGIEGQTMPVSPRRGWFVWPRRRPNQVA